MVLFAGDHGVAELSVSGRAAGSAYELVRATLDGATPLAVLARQFSVPVRIVDAGLDCDPELLPEPVVRHRVRRGTGRIDIEDALTAEEAERAVRLGMAIADEEADSGTDLVVLGDLSVGGTTAAATLIAALCGTDASVVTGRGGAGIDDLAWMRKCAAIRDALRRARPVLGDQLELLATVGGADLAATTGFLLQCAVRRMPVILDGVVSAACALVGQRAAFRAPDWWLAGQASGEPAQAKALDRMALTPCWTTASSWEKEVGHCSRFRSFGPLPRWRRSCLNAHPSPTRRTAPAKRTWTATRTAKRTATRPTADGPGTAAARRTPAAARSPHRARCTI